MSVSLRILVVDDDPAIREMLRAALEHAGHEVTEAPDFIGAVRAVEGWDFDVVIADGHFPMHAGSLGSKPEPLGPELLRWAADFSRVRILHSADDALNASMREGGITVLPKCSSLTEILKAVEG